MDNTISPLDGRYHNKLTHTASIFSQNNILKTRLAVEKAWLLYLIRHTSLPISEFNGKLLPISDEEIMNDVSIIVSFNENSKSLNWKRLADLEKETKHDVAALAQFLKETLLTIGMSKKTAEFVHFGLTSQDIVTTSYNIIVKQFVDDRNNYLLGGLYGELLNDKFGHIFLGRTHGQPAIPAKFSTEFLNYVGKIRNHTNKIKNNIKTMTTKFGGATNSFAAAKFCNPSINWDLVLDTFCKEFLDIGRSKYATQTDNYESMCDIFDSMSAISAILIDLCRDVWLYCSYGYFKLAYDEKHVGSSTMVQKINPIDFENAEGNLEIAEMWFKFLSSKLRKSRLQRDLTDSTVMRNIGVVFGHYDLAIQGMISGFNKISVDKNVLNEELDNNFQILAEAVQTKLKYAGINGGFDKVKHLFKGKRMNNSNYIHAIRELDIEPKLMEELVVLTPQKYDYT